MKMRFLIVAGAVAALAVPAGASATAPRHASQRAQIAHLSKLKRQTDPATVVTIDQQPFTD